MELNYTIQYKKGKKNTAVDALSRRSREEGHNYAMTAIVPAWIKEVTRSYKENPQVQQIITELLLNQDSQPNYLYNQGYWSIREESI